MYTRVLLAAHVNFRRDVRLHATATSTHITREPRLRGRKTVHVPIIRSHSLGAHAAMIESTWPQTPGLRRPAWHVRQLMDCKRAPTQQSDNGW